MNQRDYRSRDIVKNIYIQQTSNSGAQDLNENGVVHRDDNDGVSL